MYSGLRQNFPAGDNLDFSLIYKEFFQKLLAYGLKLGFDEEVCRDAIHDIFYTLFKSGNKRTHIENIEFYLLHSLKNRLFDLHRKEKASLMIEHDDVILDSSELIIEQIIKNEKEEHMRETLNLLLRKLTSKQRKVIHYKYVLGLKYNEIALVMGITPDAVKKILQRALRTMKDGKNPPEYILFILIVILIVKYS